ncbi:hypothetical protein UlMin_005495 [Ulmus minor]
MDEASNYNRIEEVKKFDESKLGVKGLSDSGITSIPKIFIHPPETLSELKQSPDQSISIPLIDLSLINSPTHRPKLIDQVKSAAKTFGFFQVINHGVPESTLNDTVSSVKAFHEQPHEVKSKYYKREEGKRVTFTSNYDLYKAKAASWVDSLRVWFGPEEVRARDEDIPVICRKSVVEWGVRATEVAEKVMELLSEGLGLESGKFKEPCFSESKVFVGHCYPYCPQPDLTVGITPHTDPTVVTVLLQNEVGGLQVKHGDVWIDVKHVPGGLIVNIGDFLQIISNGEYNSVEHRVLANSSKEPRISIVMFFGAGKWNGYDGYYGPLRELLSPEKPPVYRNFTIQEFEDNFYSKGIDSKSFIDKIKI